MKTSLLSKIQPEATLKACLILPFLIIVFCFLSAPSNLMAQNKKVILLIGQSNMAGRAELSEEDKTPLEGVFLLDSLGQWVSAQNPLNRYSTIRKDIGMQRLGPGWGFASQLAKKKALQPLGLVVNARGGSAIKQWSPGSEYYQEAIRRTRQALANGGELMAVLWHQGESDVEYVAHYMEELSVLIHQLRKDFDDPSLPFVAGQIIGNSQPRTDFNNLISGLPELIPYTALVSSEGLAVFDGVHFDNKSQKMLGKRYAKALLKLLK